MDLLRQLFGLDGRIAVVTGGASGLGAAFSQRARGRRRDRCHRRPQRGARGRGRGRDRGRRRQGRVQVGRRHRRAGRQRLRRQARGRPRAGRRARQQRRRRAPLADRGLHRGGVRPHPRAQPQGHLLHEPGDRPQDDRAGQGQHRQHRLDRRVHRLPALERVPCEQGRRRADDPLVRARVDRPRGACQRDRAGALRDAAAQEGAPRERVVVDDRLHPAPDAARPADPARRADRGRDLPRERRRRQGHRPHARGRRRVPEPNEHRAARRRARRGGRPRVPPRRQVHLRRDLAQPGLGVDARERRPGVRLRRWRGQLRARLLGRLAARHPERRHRPRVAGEGPAAAVDPARLAGRRGGGDRDGDRGDSAERAQRPRVRRRRDALLHRSRPAASAARSR